MKYFVYKKNISPDGKPHYLGFLEVDKSDHRIRINLPLSNNKDERKNQEEIFKEIKDLLKRLDCILVESK